MMLTTRTYLTGLAMASALAVLPVSSSFAGAPDYGTRDPSSLINMSSVIEAQNLINMGTLATANGFNVQGLASASLGGMLGSAITDAMKLDGVLGKIVNGVITAGINEGLNKITGGEGSLGGFGDTLSKTLTSVLLNQGGIQGGSSTANSLGAFSTVLNTVTAGTQMASLGGASSGDQLLGRVESSSGDQLLGRVIEGGIQGAIANNASLSQ